jgi:group I intron endonuclease
MIGIYKITSPSRKVYIGQSVNIEKRFKQYKSIYNSRLQIALNNSFKKYGVENHTFEILEECSIELLNERERYYQDFFNVLKNGLNSKLTTSKDKTGKLSNETIKKMSKSLKGKKAWNKGIKGLFLGRVVSEETKNKLKKANAGRFYSKETRYKIAVNNPTSRIIIDLNTGVFYYSIADLSRTLNINPSTLFDRLTERNGFKNNTQYKII